MKRSLLKLKALILCTVLLASSFSMIGTSWADPSNLPPSITHSPITSTEKVDLTVTATVYDETPLQQVTLTYSTNANSDDPIFNNIAMQPTAENPNIFQAVIPQSDLQNSDQLQYHITATDSQSETSRLPASTNYKVPVTAPFLEPEHLSLNLSVNQSVYGTVQVNGKGGSLSNLQLQLDSNTVTNTENILERPAKIVFDGNGLQATQRLKNGVYLNDQLLQVIPVDILNFDTYEVPIPAGALLSNTDKITIRAGNTISSEDLTGNHDDFTIRNVKLVLDDGTQLTDPTYGANESIPMGDGAPPANPIIPPILSKDFNIQIPAAVAKTIVYDWDTTQVGDGAHVLTLNDLNHKFDPIQTTIQVDNTLPDLTIQSPIENKIYKGTIPLTFESNDSGSGLKPLKLTLDGVAIANTASLRVVDLQPGEHTLQVSAQDNAGNVTVKEVHFTSVEEHPLPPQVISPADNSGNVSTDPALSVKIEDPTGDALDATFLKAYKYDFKDGLNHTAYTNASDTEPPLEMTPEGETRLASDQIQAISADDGTYMTTDDTVKFPYQRFEFKIKDNLMNAKSVDAVWNGHSFPGRRVTLYGWNYTTSQWQELDSKVAPDENDFTLKGAISVADMVRGNKANLIVQDLIPSPQTPDQYNFSFVWLPDTQFYSKSYPEIYDSQTQWIVDQAANQKIKYVIHTGDVVDDGNKPEQWVNADKSMKILDDAHIPYGIVSGNHDVQPGATKSFDYTAFGQWFGADRFANRSYYGGQFQNNRDHYDLISVNGNDFVIVYLGWQPEQPDLDWADGVLKKYADRNAIIAIHQFIDGNGKYGGAAEQVREQLIKPNNNVFLVMNGHHTNTPKNITEQFGDRTVHEVFTNYQTQLEGGMGYLRLMKFDTENNMLYMNTYSPYKDDYNWFSPKLDDLALPVKLLPIQKRVATDYISIQARTNEVIGNKLTAAPSGSVASMIWNGLQKNKMYNWYVRLEDAYDGMTESDIFTFTTGNKK
ncbi:metallophosphoesterase [Paenibacillus solisilvae]|uniref:Metallophosphoesterase n=1 Tax=Paenibacillus solisilvae TaxID=2486751 RepID=A0ABW0W4E6_9BACL